MEVNVGLPKSGNPTYDARYSLNGSDAARGNERKKSGYAF